MQTIPFGLLGAAAATPLAQRQGEADRAHAEAAGRAADAATGKHAEKSAGIGETDNDQPTSDRDADGRRLWEAPGQLRHPEEDAAPPEPRQAKDPTGASGGQLDLSG